MRVTIDRFEGNVAVVEIEPGKFVELPRELVPDAKEGDIILIQKDTEETKERKQKIEKLMNQVFEEESK